VTLVERQPVLGGMAARWHRTFPLGQSALSLINPMMAAVVLHPGIRLLTGSEVTQVRGHFGNFQVEVRQTPALVDEACDCCGLCAQVCPVAVPEAAQQGSNRRAAIYLPSPTAFPGRYVVDREHCTGCGECVPACPRGAINLEAREETAHHLRVGSIVVATGFLPFDPRGSRYESWAALPGVITSVTLERLLAPDGPTQGRVTGGAALEPKDIAFILCVGSREEKGNRYCSGLLPHRLETGPELKARSPQARIRISTDIRPPRNGPHTARRPHPVCPGQERSRPRRGRLVIRAENELLGAATEDRVDLVVLAVGMAPGNSTALKEVLKLPVGSDGFFLEAHPKLRPLETVLDGIYLAGACQGPKDLADSLTQASGAAARSYAVCPRDHYPDGLIAKWMEKCTGAAR
jgi:heterodisulfide reductase subunit A